MNAYFLAPMSSIAGCWAEPK